MESISELFSRVEIVLDILTPFGLLKLNAMLLHFFEVFTGVSQYNRFGIFIAPMPSRDPAGRNAGQFNRDDLLAP